MENVTTEGLCLWERLMNGGTSNTTFVDLVILEALQMDDIERHVIGEGYPSGTHCRHGEYAT